jgi:hypothetical protein
LQKLLRFFCLCVICKISHCFPQAFGFIGFIDGDGQRLNPKIIFESIGNIFRCCKGEGRDRKDYACCGHAGALASPELRVYYVSGTI